MQITKNTSIEEVLKKIPKSSEVFRKHNMECLGCGGATNDTLEGGSIAHGVDVYQLMSDLKKLTPGKK